MLLQLSIIFGHNICCYFLVVLKWLIRISNQQVGEWGCRTLREASLYPELLTYQVVPFDAVVF